MTAAMRMMEENVKLVDGVMLVLDSRAPRASLNNKLAKLFNNKKVLYVLNKADLVTVADSKKTVAEFVAEGKEAVAVSAMDKRAVDLLYSKIFSLLKEKLERNKEKGVFKPIRIMVAGIPNTGKSTIINALCGGKKAVTGNKAGVTKGKQWVRLRELELLDTPGILWPKFEDQTVGQNLAATGAIKDDVLDLEAVAVTLCGQLYDIAPEKLCTRYKLGEKESLEGLENWEIFEKIGKKRGMLISGGEIDSERTANMILDEFRQSKIGTISLERPIFEQEQEEV
jgi:ribosome biogenesis GTPase A